MGSDTGNDRLSHRMLNVRLAVSASLLVLSLGIAVRTLVRLVRLARLFGQDEIACTASPATGCPYAHNHRVLTEAGLWDDAEAMWFFPVWHAAAMLALLAAFFFIGGSGRRVRTAMAATAVSVAALLVIPIVAYHDTVETALTVTD